MGPVLLNLPTMIMDLKNARCTQTILSWNVILKYDIVLKFFVFMWCALGEEVGDPCHAGWSDYRGDGGAAGAGCQHDHHLQPEGLVHKVPTCIEYRAMSGVFRTNYWPPHPRSAQRVCPPPAPKAGVGGFHTRRAVRVVGGGARHWIGLLQYKPSTVLCLQLE